MTAEVHFTAVQVLCKQAWQPVFTVVEGGFLEHPLEVKMRTDKENCFIDIFYNGDLQLGFKLERESATSETKTNRLYKTNVVYANPWWMLKSFEFAMVLSQTTGVEGDLSLTFLDAQYEKLLGLEVEHTGLTGTPATQEDTVH